MNHLRIGKIARLPKTVREVLNDRLDQGEPATDLVDWLNGLATVQASLTEHFGGRPITEQNLSEWRAGGYQDWLRQEEARHLVKQLTEDGGDVAEVAKDQEISDRLARRLSVELVRLAQILVEQEPDPVKRWASLREVSLELSRLRKDDHRALQLQLLRRKVELVENESFVDKLNRRGREESERRCSPQQSSRVLKDLEEQVRIRAEMMASPKPHQSAASSGKKAATPPPASAVPAPETPTESPRIQPNPTKSDPSTPPDRARLGRSTAETVAPSELTNPVPSISQTTSVSSPIQLNPTFQLPRTAGP